MAQRKSPEKPIAFEKRTVAQEDLPLPFVNYPGHYGTFIAFSDTPDGTPTLCDCTRSAIENYITDRCRTKPLLNSDRRRMFVVDSLAFPLSVVDWVSSRQLEMSPSCIDVIEFGRGLCHCCNRAVPSYRWCHEMYGSPFKQTYGWYVSQRRFEIGVFDHRIDYQICPDEICELLIIDPNTFIEKHTEMQAIDVLAAEKFYKDFSRQTRQVDRVIEDMVRERFDFRPMGSGSTGESILFQIVKRIFPGEPIHRCSRPDFLDGLELDVFLPQRSLAFEFQGQQHYDPVEHWGGDDGLTDLRERDERKRKACSAQGIDLIEVRFDEPLTEAELRARIEQSGSNKAVQ